MGSTYDVAFAGHSVRIQCADKAVSDMLAFLFAPHQLQGGGEPKKMLHISAGDEPDRYTLQRGQQILAANKPLSELYVWIFDAVIHALIGPASDGLALHAGALCRRNATLVLPGVSGAGKSTLTAWFASRGWSYLTDELIYLREGLQAEYLTRPISIKTGSRAEVDQLLGPHVAQGQVHSASHNGIFFSHRLLTDHPPVAEPPPVALILFPSFHRNQAYELERLSRASAATQIMNTLVNARNLPRHGVGQVIDLVSRIPVLKLRYGSFQQLDALEEQIQPLLAGARPRNLGLPP